MPIRTLRESFGPLLSHNVRLRGPKALVYCYGLSASRYVEYASAMEFASPSLDTNSVVVDLGCGHSILPSFLKALDFHVVAVDLNPDALKWQKNKGKEVAKESLDVVLADLRFLPIRSDVVNVVFCISAIEHVPGEGDIHAACEIGRILANRGIVSISFSLSSYQESFSCRSLSLEIPSMVRRLMGSSFLIAVFRKFGVDRTASYFERFFSLNDVEKRIVAPCGCEIEDVVALRSRRVVKFVYERVFPTGVSTFFEYLMSRIFILSNSPKNMDAVIFKLRKIPLHERTQLEP